MVIRISNFKFFSQRLITLRVKFFNGNRDKRVIRLTGRKPIFVRAIRRGEARLRKRYGMAKKNRNI